MLALWLKSVTQVLHCPLFVGSSLLLVTVHFYFYLLLDVRASSSAAANLRSASTASLSGRMLVDGRVRCCGFEPVTSRHQHVFYWTACFLQTFCLILGHLPEL